MLPRQEILGKLIPYVEGRVGQQEVPLMTRLLALWGISSGQPQLIGKEIYKIVKSPLDGASLKPITYVFLTPV